MGRRKAARASADYMGEKESGERSQDVYASGLLAEVFEVEAFDDVAEGAELLELLG